MFGSLSSPAVLEPLCPNENEGCQCGHTTIVSHVGEYRQYCVLTTFGAIYFSDFSMCARCVQHVCQKFRVMGPPDSVNIAERLFSCSGHHSLGAQGGHRLARVLTDP